MIHLNIGSNLDSKHGSRFDNISIAIILFVDSHTKIIKISNLIVMSKILVMHLVLLGENWERIPYLDTEVSSITLTTAMNLPKK